jgi:hypothetical protein
MLSTIAEIIRDLLIFVGVIAALLIAHGLRLVCPYQDGQILETRRD